MSGVNIITLYDNDLVTKDDLITNEFTKKEDINKFTLSQATQRGLSGINNTSLISAFKGNLIDNINLLNDFNIIIITNIIEFSEAEIINNYCRKKRKGFIYAGQIGFLSFLFEDYGDNFLVHNKNGKKCKKYFIKSITNSCPGIVEIDPVEKIEGYKNSKKYLQLETGDYVVFKGVSGMVELNDSPPRPIRVLSKNKFTIEETTKYYEFTGLGIIEEMKLPFQAEFIPLSQAKKEIYFTNFNESNVESNNNILDEKIFDIEYEEMIDNEIKDKFDDNLLWMNIFNITNKNETLIKDSNSKIHLALLTLHEYYSIHKYLPKYNDEQSIKDCIDISSRIFSKSKQQKEQWVNELENIDIKYLTNIFKYSGFFFIPIIKFFSGIVAQEALKFIGLYKPVNQWIYFNFLEFINNNSSFLDNEKLLNDINIKFDFEQFMICDKEKIKILKQTNIAIVGCNDISLELLNLFIRLNLVTNITILDKVKNEIYYKICKLKDIYDFKIIVTNNILDNLSDQYWWVNSKIIIDSLTYKYNNNLKDLLSINSKKFNKILINVNANKSIGSFEFVLPDQLIKSKYISLSLEDINTPVGDEIKKDKINNPHEEPKYLNIQSLKESLDFSKTIFDNYFNVNIKHLNELIKRSNEEENIMKYIDDLIQKENDNEKIIKLIRYLKKLISLKYGMSFESIVLTACEIFQEIFQFSTDEILFKYPEDYIELGKHKKFWSGKKYPPKATIFNVNDDDHFQLIYLITYFFCQILGKKDFENRMKDVKSIAKQYEIRKFDSSIITRAKDQKFFSMEKNSLIRFFSLYEKKKKFEFKEIELNIENNEDINDFAKLNNHLKFLILTSKLIMKNYGIITNNNIYKCISLLFKIDNIFPTVISSISGLILFQILLMFNDSDFIKFFSSSNGKTNKIKEDEIKEDEIKEDEIKDDEIVKENNDNKESGIPLIFKNVSFNLGLNIYLFYNIFKNK